MLTLLAIMEIFAQATPPALPDTGWFAANWGFLGVLGLFVLAGGAAYFWFAHLPHKIATQKQALDHQAAKQAIEIEKEKKQAALLDTLRENEGSRRVNEARVAESLERLTTVSERLATLQTRHADDCSATRQIVQAMASK